MQNGWKRFYKLSLLSGLALASPMLVGTLWYAWSAFATVDRYRRALDPKRELDLELFQIALHDELTRDRRRLMLPDRPAPDRLPTCSLAVTRANLDKLGGAGGEEGDAAYVKGNLSKDGNVYEIKLRQRGDQPWHALGAQKSLKVRLDKGDLVDGTRVFNLINDPTPFGLEDQLILDLARDSGLLAPEYHPVWVRLTNSDLGVYRYEAQPDETLLRRHRRMPGSMYSGDSEVIDPVSGTGALFNDRSGWQKIASHSEEEKTDFSEL